MNAIGTQLRDSINSGLTRWRHPKYSPSNYKGVEEQLRSEPLRFARFLAQRFQVSISASSSGVETRRKSGLPGRIPAAPRKKRSTGSASPYYGGSGVRWDASAPYQELRGSTGHGQPSIPLSEESMERHAEKRRSIIRWRSAYAVLKMGRIPRETTNHQCRRATKRTSRKKRNH